MLAHRGFRSTMRVALPQPRSAPASPEKETVRLEKEQTELMELDKAEETAIAETKATELRINAILDTLADQRAALSAAKERLAEITSKRGTLITRMSTRTIDLPDVRIYVLCHNEERLEYAQQAFRGFYWAVPVLMKYQDRTFENAFWKQLLELKEEWEGCDMVGVLSSKAPKKRNLNSLDSIITNRAQWASGYFNFMDSNKPITTGGHPHLLRIVTDIKNELHLPDPTESVCNYWMCKPAWMLKFIAWHENVLKPAVLAHSLIMTDAKYRGDLTTDQCQALCGIPYYPHVPFVLERLNKTFFMMRDRPNVRIYVLCHNQERLTIAKHEFAKYYWAFPILMKYQDNTQENAFWKQLSEIEDEWRECDMVGTLSSRAHVKVKVDVIDNIINNRDKWASPHYHHFMETGRPIDYIHHPHLETIITDTCKQLNKTIPVEAFCNYWMCKPALMKRFIPWVTETLIPVVLAHPLSLTDAKYTEGTLSPEECMMKWRVPYYPHITFVLERLTSLFFNNRIILVSHENSRTGAPIVLEQLCAYLSSQNYNASLVYLDSSTMAYINQARKFNDVVVICNTLVTRDIARACRDAAIPVIWYIHEWIDETSKPHYQFLLQDLSLYRVANRLIFPCEKAFNNHNIASNNSISDISRIIPHGYDLDIFREKQRQPVTFTKEPGSIYIGIVGTIDNRKNQDAFIQHVFKPLSNTYPHIKLVLIGKMWVKIELPPNVIAIGCVDNSIPYIDLLDIVVSYSLNEVLPMNMVEACLCKKAIVASDAGGSSEIITDMKSGFIVGINDHATTISRLAELIESSALRQEYGTAAYENALVRFDQNRNFPKFETCIVDLLNSD